MKAAVILNGNIRTWNQTRDNFNSTFETLSPDVYVSTYNRQWGYHPHIKNVTNYHEDVILSEQEIVSQFESTKNVINIDIEDAVEVDNYITLLNRTCHPSMKNLINSISQFRKVKLALDNILEHEYNNNFKYDFIIKTRCDLIYNPINFNISKDDALVDSGNVFPNDCFFMIERDKFIDVANFLIEEFFTPRYDDSNRDAPHTMFKNALDYNKLNIKTEKIINYVLRVSGPQYY